MQKNRLEDYRRQKSDMRRHFRQVNRSEFRTFAFSLTSLIYEKIQTAGILQKVFLGR